MPLGKRRGSRTSVLFWRALRARRGFLRRARGAVWAVRSWARLALRGYTILRFDYYQVLFDPAYVIDTVLTAIAQGLHLAPPHRR